MKRLFTVLLILFPFFESFCQFDITAGGIFQFNPLPSGWVLSEDGYGYIDAIDSEGNLNILNGGIIYSNNADNVVYNYADIWQPVGLWQGPNYVFGPDYFPTNSYWPNAYDINTINDYLVGFCVSNLWTQFSFGYGDTFNNLTISTNDVFNNNGTIIGSINYSGTNSVLYDASNQPIYMKGCIFTTMDNSGSHGIFDSSFWGSNFNLSNEEIFTIMNLYKIVSSTRPIPEFTDSFSEPALYTLDDAIIMMRDLRVGSQTFSVSNGNAKIRMYVDESGNLTDWTNTPHVLELDIPADTDMKFFRFRMD